MQGQRQDAPPIPFRAKARLASPNTAGNVARHHAPSQLRGIVNGRLTSYGWVIGFALLVAGGYGLWIDADTSPVPTRIGIGELEKRVPGNRNLVVTGGLLATNEAFALWNTRSGTTVEGTEVNFIPVRNPESASGTNAPPRVLLRIGPSAMKSIQAGHPVDPAALRGIRTTQFTLHAKAKALLAETYGGAAAKRMLILEYGKEANGPWRNLGFLVGGIVVLGLSFGATGMLRRPRITA